MTEEIHSCSYYCDRPACIKAQRDELRRWFETEHAALELIAAPMRSDGTWSRDRLACQQLALAALGLTGK